MFFAVVLTVLFISVPAFAGSAHDNNSIGIGSNNTQVSGHHNTVGGNHGTNAGGTISNKNTNTNLNLNTNTNKNTNTNLNCNTNKNTNTNTNRQSQGQQQGQQQGQTQNQTAHNEGVNQTITFEDKREFAPGPATVIAGFADYVGSETPGHVYSTIDEMLTFGRVFTESQLISMAGDRGIRNAIVDITMMDSNMARQKPTMHPTAKEKTITFYYKAAVPAPIRRGAFVTVAMKSVKGISVETLGKTGVAALEVGANSVFLTAQGFDITQSQHSIAIGPGVSFSSVGGSGDKGVTGGGGLNYSYGVFGKNYKPYLRSMALYIEDANHKYAPKGKPVQK